MAEAGLQEVETYFSFHHNIVAQFITTRPIIDRCLAAEKIPGPRVSKRWWNQDRVDVEGIRAAPWEAEWIEGQ